MIIDCDPYAIGQALKRERVAQGLTCKQLGDRVFVTHHAVSTRETQGVDRLTTLKQYWEALGFEVALDVRRKQPCPSPPS